MLIFGLWLKNAPFTPFYRFGHGKNFSMPSKKFIWAPKMPHLPQSVHSKDFLCKTKSQFKPLFNACHQVQFQKNLTYRFK